MTDDEKKTSWWSTLPGILTASAAVITAVTGLILGLGQLGVFDRQPADGSARGVATSPAAAPGSDAPPTSSSGGAVTLPEQRSYRSGDIEYVLLEATTRPDVAGQQSLEITVRCTNHGRYDINFWDATFRLHAGGVNVAPDSGLNEVCEGDSSTTGTVRFVVPAGVSDPVLRIKFPEGESTAPLVITPA